VKYPLEIQSAMPLIELRTQRELEMLSPTFVRTLVKELDVLCLEDRMCPVLFGDGSAGIFVLSQHYFDDQTAALLALLKERGYRLSATALYVLSPALLIAVTQSVRTASNSASVLSEPPVRDGALTTAMNAILLWALQHRASDIHFNVKRTQSESAVMFTIDGRYVCPERYSRLPTATMLAMLSVTWMDVKGGNGAVFDSNQEQQGRVTRELNGQTLHLRWASLSTDQGPSVCLRLLILDPTTLTPELTDLGYLETQIDSLRRASLAQGGAIILAGTVGSGKSTTIATLMREIPSYRKVITLEDPAEYYIPNALQNTVSRSVEESADDVFDNKLKAFKRSAMNDLLIGEIRDVAGGRAFSDLSGSGVSIYTTVHAGSALWISERLSSSFIGVPRDLLATPGILKLLVFQCLLPKLCHGCSKSFEDINADATWYCASNLPRTRCWRNEWLAKLEEITGIARQKMKFRSETGCVHCLKSLSDMRGICGRTVAAEVIEPGEDPDFLNGIKRQDGIALHRWFESRPRTGLSNPDMRGKNAKQSAFYKVSTGLVDPRDVERIFGVCDFSKGVTHAVV
jgi:general secretion pathway protein E